jgi:hypothetical protein
MMSDLCHNTTTTFWERCPTNVQTMCKTEFKDLLLYYFSSLNFLLMTPIEQPDMNHSTKTMSIFGKLFLSSGRFQHSLSTLGFVLLRPLTPLLPTPLRCDWLPSGKACCNIRQGKARQGNFIYVALFIHKADSKYITIHRKSGLFYVDKSRKFEQVNRDRRP